MTEKRRLALGAEGQIRNSPPEEDEDFELPPNNRHPTTSYHLSIHLCPDIPCFKNLEA
jgi:hypothetical protein